jgi:hypothetical protein
MLHMNTKRIPSYRTVPFTPGKYINGERIIPIETIRSARV